MTWSAAYDIEYNTSGSFQTSDINTPGYYFFDGLVMHIPYRNNICHTFDPPVIILEGEPVFPVKFIAPMRKTSYWYHNPDEAIPVMLKLKQVVMPYM